MYSIIMYNATGITQNFISLLTGFINFPDMRISINITVKKSNTFKWKKK